MQCLLPYYAGPMYSLSCVVSSILLLMAMYRFICYAGPRATLCRADIQLLSCCLFYPLTHGYVWIHMLCTASCHIVPSQYTASMYCLFFLPNRFLFCFLYFLLSAGLECSYCSAYCFLSSSICCSSSFVHLLYTGSGLSNMLLDC